MGHLPFFFLVFFWCFEMSSKGDATSEMFYGGSFWVVSGSSCKMLMQMERSEAFLFSFDWGDELDFNKK